MVKTHNGTAPHAHQLHNSLFTFMTGAELRKEGNAGWLIEDILPSEGFSVLFGRDGTNKSTLADDFAMSIAHASNWNGRAVKNGNVAYVVGEGSSAIATRYEAWRSAKGLPDSDNIGFTTSHLGLSDPRDADDLVRGLRRSFKFPPKFVVIDTLSACFGGGDENLQVDMKKVTDNCKLIARELRAHVMIIHHTNQSGQQKRGSTVLGGDAEARFQVKKKKLAKGLGEIELVCEKQRNAPAFDPIKLRLREVELDKPVGSFKQSVVLDPVDAPRTANWDYPAVFEEYERVIRENGGKAGAREFEKAMGYGATTVRKWTRYFTEQGKLEVSKEPTGNTQRNVWRIAS